MAESNGDDVLVAPPGSETAELLTPPHNFAVVQLPHRRYPGVVFQGDSLASLCDLATAVAEATAETPASDDAAELRDELNDILRIYIEVLSRRGIELPFMYRPPVEQ